MAKQHKIEILILDDEKQFTEELYEFFQNSGFEAFEANTEREARKILTNHEIDLLILDVRLPGVNGLDILKDVKIQFPAMEGHCRFGSRRYGYGDQSHAARGVRLSA